MMKEMTHRLVVKRGKLCPRVPIKNKTDLQTGNFFSVALGLLCNNTLVELSQPVKCCLLHHYRSQPVLCDRQIKLNTLVLVLHHD